MECASRMQLLMARKRTAPGRAASGVAQHDGAGAAVAFAAAFLGAGAVQIFAQHFQQCAVGRNVVQRDAFAAAHESQRLDAQGGIAHGSVVA